MCRTGGLTGGGAGIGDMLATGAVAGIPSFLGPIEVVGQLLLLVDDRLLGAELLTQLDGIVCALIHALAAGNALFPVDFGDIVALRERRSVKILRYAQCKATFRLAVADCKGVAVLKRGYLMHAADLLDMAHHLVGFLLGELFASAKIYKHIRTVTHEQTEAFVHIACALAHELAHTAALTGKRAQVVGVFLYVIADPFLVDLLCLGGYCAFNGNDPHDACTHGGVHGMLGLAIGSVLLKGIGYLGVSAAERLV